MKELFDRRGKDHEGLPAAGEICDSYARAGVERRGTGGGGKACKLLPLLFRAGVGARV